MDATDRLRAIRAAAINATELNVLRTINDYTDASGRAYPDVPRIAADCKLAVRTVQRVLAKFEAAGLLDRHRRRDAYGRYLSDYITVAWDRLPQPGQPWPTRPSVVQADLFADAEPVETTQVTPVVRETAHHGRKVATDVREIAPVVRRPYIGRKFEETRRNTQTPAAVVGPPTTDPRVCLIDSFFAAYLATAAPRGHSTRELDHAAGLVARHKLDAATAAAVGERAGRAARDRWAGLANFGGAVPFVDRAAATVAKPAPKTPAVAVARPPADNAIGAARRRFDALAAAEQAAWLERAKQELPAAIAATRFVRDHAASLYAAGGGE